MVLTDVGSVEKKIRADTVSSNWYQSKTQTSKEEQIQIPNDFMYKHNTGYGNTQKYNGITSNVIGIRIKMRTVLQK